MARVTGGSLPAETWKEYMVFAHSTPNIPPIPGLPLHPNQEAEMERVAAIRKDDPTLGTPITSSLHKISPETRKVLESVAALFKEAAAKGPVALVQSSPDIPLEPASASSDKSRLRFIQRLQSAN